MITLNNRKYEVIDAHAHVWKEFKGERFGDTPVEKIGNGRVRSQVSTEQLFCRIPVMEIKETT